MLTIDLQPKLYAKQYEAIYAPSRYSLIEASTKSGKTFGCMHWIVNKSCEAPSGANTWWIAPVFKQARIAYNRIKRGLEPFKEHGFHFKDTTQQIIFPNQVTLSFFSGDDYDNLYGDDVYAAVLDEASRMKADAMHAVRSTLTATNGECRMIGNVKGRGNEFYRLCRLTEQGLLKNARRFKLDAYDAIDAGILTLEEIEDARAILPENIFNELYLAEPSDDGGNPFGIKHIQNCVVSELSDLPPVVYGLDLAKSTDYTVLIGLDANNVVCYFDRWQGDWSFTLSKVKAVIANTLTIVDSTGVGDPIAEMLDNLGCNIIPFNFSNKSKQQLMEGLAVSIQKNNIKFPSGIISEELMVFEYSAVGNKVTYSAPNGFHDDCVMALALANSEIMDNVLMEVLAMQSVGRRDTMTMFNERENTGVEEWDYSLKSLNSLNLW
jgi:hypothetical protein